MQRSNIFALRTLSHDHKTTSKAKKHIAKQTPREKHFDTDFKSLYHPCLLLFFKRTLREQTRTKLQSLLSLVRKEDKLSQLMLDCPERSVQFKALIHHLHKEQSLVVAACKEKDQLSPQHCILKLYDSVCPKENRPRESTPLEMSQYIQKRISQYKLMLGELFAQIQAIRTEESKDIGLYAKIQAIKLIMNKKYLQSSREQSRNYSSNQYSHLANNLKKQIKINNVDKNIKNYFGEIKKQFKDDKKYYQGEIQQLKIYILNLQKQYQQQYLLHLKQKSFKQIGTETIKNFMEQKFSQTQTKKYFQFGAMTQIRNSKQISTETQITQTKQIASKTQIIQNKQISTETQITQNKQISTQTQMIKTKQIASITQVSTQQISIITQIQLQGTKLDQKNVSIAGIQRRQPVLGYINCIGYKFAGRMRNPMSLNFCPHFTLNSVICVAQFQVQTQNIVNYSTHQYHLCLDRDDKNRMSIKNDSACNTDEINIMEKCACNQGLEWYQNISKEQSYEEILNISLLFEEESCIAPDIMFLKQELNECRQELEKLRKNTAGEAEDVFQFVL